MRAAWIGLGAMGRPMAANLAGKVETLVHNRTVAVAEEHASEHGTTAVELPATAEADVVFTCLSTTADVIDVADRLEPHLRAGTVWVDCTSGDPAPSRQLAERLRERGVSYLDAPVSGGTDGAAAGTLTMMVGGDADALERVSGLLDAMSSRVVHVGDVGAGHAVKAVNNALLAINLWAAGEGLAALTAQGVDPRLALEVVNGSSGRSFPTERLIPERVLDRSFPNTFKVGLLRKDIGIALGVLDGSGVPAPALRLAGELYRVATQELGPDADHVEAVRLVERWGGVEITPGSGQD